MLNHEIMTYTSRGKFMDDTINDISQADNINTERHPIAITHRSMKSGGATTGRVTGRFTAKDSVRDNLRNIQKSTNIESMNQNEFPNY